MSANNRGALRRTSDFYSTPQGTVDRFVDAFRVQHPGFLENRHLMALDPCAGGRTGKRSSMPYPTALERHKVFVRTLDIREDSAASMTGVDYLAFDMPWSPSLIITNPPYTLAKQFVEKALRDVAAGGFVVMLLRLNFLGAQRRREWWQNRIPRELYIHSQRPSFTGNGSDACEYAHFVWQKQSVNQSFSESGSEGCTRLFVI